MKLSELKEIEDRANAASPGPWLYSARRHEVDTAQIGLDGLVYDYKLIGSVEPELYLMSDEDGQFIAHSRQDIPALIAEVRRLQALLDERNQPKLDLHFDASNTRVVPGWEAPSQSLEIKSDKRSAWEYNDELHAYVCHYSPRSDYRLVVSLVLSERDYFIAEVEWIGGGSDCIGKFEYEDEAQEAAIAWAEKYESQQ